MTDQPLPFIIDNPTWLGSNSGQFRVRATDPDTSRAAAASLNRHGVESHKTILLGLIRHSGDYGRTTAELLAILRKTQPDKDWDRGNLSRRVTDLAHDGKVYDSRRRREGPSGRSGIVWVSVDR